MSYRNSTCKILSLVLDKVMRYELECDLIKCVCAVIVL